MFKLKTALVSVILLLIAGCGSSPRSEESTLPAPGGARLTGEMAEVADIAAALKEAGFGWWLRGPSGGADQVGFSALLSRVAELEAAGQQDEAGRLLEWVTHRVRLAALQAENSAGAAPAYPAP